MASSHTHNVETSIPTRLFAILQTWELNASSGESITQMEDFTSMYSQISDGSFAAEELTFSMWEAATQTSRLLKDLRDADTTMRSRMATLSLGDWPDLKDQMRGLTILAESGLRLSRLNLVTSFWSYASDWLREILSLPGAAFSNSQTGDLLPRLRSMVPQQEWGSTRQVLMDAMIGCRRVVSATDLL